MSVRADRLYGAAMDATQQVANVRDRAGRSPAGRPRPVDAVRTGHGPHRSPADAREAD